jgi:hypothetical protein
MKNPCSFEQHLYETEYHTTTWLSGHIPQKLEFSKWFLRKNQWHIVSQLLLEQNVWQAWLLVFLPTKLSVLLKTYSSSACLQKSLLYIYIYIYTLPVRCFFYVTGTRNLYIDFDSLANYLYYYREFAVVPINNIYIYIYIYIYKRLKWFVKQHQVHKTKW